MSTSSIKLYRNNIAEYYLRQISEEIRRERERLDKLEDKVENYRLLAREGLIFGKPEKLKVKI